MTRFNKSQGIKFIADLFLFIIFLLVCSKVYTMWLGFFLHVEKQFWDEKTTTNAFYRMKQVNWTLIEMSWKVPNWQSYII